MQISLFLQQTSLSLEYLCFW